MIRANELRINNCVFIEGHGDNTFVVLDIGSALSTVNGGPVFKVEYEKMNPIPLTPEWLERCGFVSTLSGDDFHDAVIWDDPKSGYHYCEAGHFIDNRGHYGHYCDIGDIKFIHQLQNLYFALTSEDLTINNIPFI